MTSRQRVRSDASALSSASPRPSVDPALAGKEREADFGKPEEEIFELAKDYDYVFMHEDDVLVQQPFKLEHLVFLNDYQSLSAESLNSFA